MNKSNINDIMSHVANLPEAPVISAKEEFKKINGRLNEIESMLKNIENILKDLTPKDTDS